MPLNKDKELTVSDDLILSFDESDTWIAIRDVNSYECNCVLLGYIEIDPLIRKLTEVKRMIDDYRKSTGPEE